MPFPIYLASAYDWSGAPTAQQLPGVKPILAAYESSANTFGKGDPKCLAGIIDPAYDANEPAPRKSCFYSYQPDNCAALADYAKQHGFDTIYIDAEQGFANPLPNRVAMGARELVRITADLQKRGLKVALASDGLDPYPDLLAAADILCPNCYPYTQRWGTWAVSRGAKVRGLKAAHPQKQVWPFVTFAGVGQSGDDTPAIKYTDYVGDGAVVAQVLSLKEAGADGIVVWAGFDGTAAQPFGKWPGDPGWAVVKQFIAS